MPTTDCVFLDLRSTPILQQLRIEEALLRTTNQNFCIINAGVKNAVVLGISRNLVQDVHVSRVQADKIPIIRRYSGGGTVFIDANTLMVSWIINSPKVFVQPQEILTWTYALYHSLFPATFVVFENDYALGDKKVGGNAHYIQRYRWVQHTTFLWDMDIDKLAYYLPLPEKQPVYRRQRSHQDFLTTLRPWFFSKESFFDKLKASGNALFSWQTLSKPELQEILLQPHRKTTTLLP
ncbi:lipoate--protein ligase family protein [Candidatus Chlamydia sanziniae]|uniref:Lipoate-protein ligase A type 2 n=1 Tax=Candidatus Chlamydia sanziniae TaxID=1806891 RepID=A0A1A9HTU5_9CHLA|nr:lipoate--protein ligase family protein [Candidatus Chlamydia sanziniae]ANH78418.1 Lipoate-protein ligase A type 2 [Candidatus Chlamydia sanziniae]